jgi:hypothetical protein
MERKGRRWRQSMAISARCCVAKKLQLRAVAQDGQPRDAIDKLGVTGSSPVPPIRKALETGFSLPEL